MRHLEMDRDVTTERAAYGLSAEPFQPGTSLKFLWLGEAQREALDNLKSGILNNEGVLALTGDVGTGKTMLVHALLEDLGDRVAAASVSCGGLEAVDVLDVIAEAYGLEPPAGSRELFRHRFERFLGDAASRGQTVLLVIDEAQSLSADLVSEIRGLTATSESGAPRLNVLLVGQNELDAILSEPDNAALTARIKVRATTRPLTPPEVKQYVEHRLKMAGASRPVFTAGALREIAAFSQGIPRLVNVIGDLALASRLRRSAGTINAEIVKACAGRLGRSRRKARAPGRGRQAAAPSVEAKEPVGTPQSPTDAPANGTGRASASEARPTDDRDTGTSGHDVRAAPGVKPEGRAAPPPHPSAGLNGNSAALGSTALETDDRDTRGGPRERRLVPSARGEGQAALARLIASCAAALVLLLALAGGVYYASDSALPRRGPMPEGSRAAAEAGDRSDAVPEPVVHRATTGEPDGDAPKPALPDVLPPSSEIIPSHAPPKAVTGKEDREVTGWTPGPAAASSVVPGQTPAPGRRPGGAGRDEIPTSARRPGGTAAPLAGRPDTTDSGAIIDWLLNEYPARRQ